MGTSILNGIIIPNYKKPLIRIPSSIKNSMVLWYDIAKQKATNESMAANPILKDLSGNGHDATCHNFAWAGMSGIGRYVTNYNTYGKYKGVEVNDHVITSTTVEEGVNSDWLVFIGAKTNEVPSYKIRVTGTTSLTGLTYKYVDENNTVQYFNIQGDGEYTLPAIHHYNGDSSNQNCGFQIIHREPLLIIEQLPQYPNALVSDGVDDYAYVEGLPLLTKEQGYTVVAKRKYLTGIRQSCLASKRNSSLPNGAFVFELYISNWRLDSFGHANAVSLEESDISYQTSKSYNGKAINVGEESDNNVLQLLALSGNYLANVALYSFLLFNRDLTEEEIEWVKTNLLGEKKSEFNEALVDGWIFNGTNDNFPDTIKGINGRGMILYGFDGTTESGFNNGLQFDGVDDYTKVSGLPILNDFTVICHREILSDTYRVASKAEAWNTGAFILESSAASNGGGRTYGSLTGYLGIDKSEQTVYMTPTSYKGNGSVVTFNRGQNSDTEYLWLGRERDSGDYTKMNIKYILLYNKTLTDEEIQVEIEKAERRFNNN